MNTDKDKFSQKVVRWHSKAIVKISYKDAVKQGLVKFCFGCKAKKSVTEFYQAPSGKFGVGGRCKLCVKERQNEYYKKPEVVLRQQEYYARPEQLQKRKELQATPEQRAIQKAYRELPEYKAKAKAYRQTPEYKAKEKIRKQSPEYKAQVKAHREQLKANKIN